ncbi:zinc finger CCCH domain-containing protein 48-like [Olea europaea var. sylvestris]|uniref:Zinc finger CCCH domain-containing 48 n=1 Tax=Olea europaea subsp. europaea TaxID=158383 RepID=A0A8S0V5D3_OLEEU|nr:zinc finger CCCH domain-containing protein 48-like [Olea europaea var. sylvestris]CAA3026675.1 zinc finger CCCH domain-containing 48 [Olea europaea subsp. europaea]
MDMNGGRRVYHRLGQSASSGYSDNKQQKVCYHWRQGKCSRFPCSFLHSELPGANNGESSKRAHQGFEADSSQGGGLRRSRNSNFNNTWGRVQGQGGGSSSNMVVKKMEKLCNHWLQGNCKFGDNCKYLHQWSTGDCFSLLTPLEGHQQVVTGIALPMGLDKLYTGSQDESVRVWDCQSGQVVGVVNVGGAVGCMLSEGPWLFVGLTNLVKAWNIQTSTDLSLNGPVGQVYSLVIGNDMLFAGTQDGTILAWKFNVATNCFEPAASLKGHTLAVVTLVVGANRLYSGSMDHSIRVWNLETLQCLQTLRGHTDVVMSVLCWDQFLLSSSLDKTIKVWVATENGTLEATYTHIEEHGVLTLCGMHDSEAKPVLFCSCNDNTIRVYDLPSFSERAKIFSKKEVRAIHIGPSGLFFTGDGSGQVRVWKWSAESVAI